MSPKRAEPEYAKLFVYVINETSEPHLISTFASWSKDFQFEWAGWFSGGNYGPGVEHPLKCQWSHNHPASALSLGANTWRGVYTYWSTMGRDRVLDMYRVMHIKDKIPGHVIYMYPHEPYK